MEKCSHATVNRTDVRLDRWTRQGKRLSTTRIGRLSVDDCTRRQTDDYRWRLTSRTGRNREAVDHSARRMADSVVTVPRRLSATNKRPATTRPDGEQATSHQTADDDKRLNDSRSTTPCVDTADGEEHLSTHDCWQTNNSSARHGW